MTELYRLSGKNQDTETTLVLTATHLIIEPTPAFRAKIEEGFKQGREGAAQAPGFIGWVVEKALSFASNQVERIFQPHPLQEVELHLQHDRLGVKIGHLHYDVGHLEVDPTEAFIFDAKFHEAKKALLLK